MRSSPLVVLLGPRHVMVVGARRRLVLFWAVRCVRLMLLPGTLPWALIIVGAFAFAFVGGWWSLWACTFVSGW